MFRSGPSDLKGEAGWRDDRRPVFLDRPTVFRSAPAKTLLPPIGVKFFTCRFRRGVKPTESTAPLAFDGRLKVKTRTPGLFHARRRSDPKSSVHTDYNTCTCPSKWCRTMRFTRPRGWNTHDVIRTIRSWSINDDDASIRRTTWVWKKTYRRNLGESLMWPRSRRAGSRGGTGRRVVRRLRRPSSRNVY